MHLFLIGLGTVFGLLATVFTVYLSWNMAIPALFGLPQITVPQSLFLTLLVRTLTFPEAPFHVGFAKREAQP